MAVMQEHAGHAGIRSDLAEVTYVDPFRVRRVGTHFAYVRYPAGLSRTADLARGKITMADAPGLERAWALDGTVPDGGQRGPSAGESRGAQKCHRRGWTRSSSACPRIGNGAHLDPS